MDDELPSISWKDCGVSLRNCDPKTGFEDPIVSSQIWGGEFARTGEYPWFAVLHGMGTHCGAAILNEWWALTAEHCVGFVLKATISPRDQ